MFPKIFYKTNIWSSLRYALWPLFCGFIVSLTTLEALIPQQSGSGEAPQTDIVANVSTRQCSTAQTNVTVTPVDVDFDAIFAFISNTKTEAIAQLREFVAIRSVSVESMRRNETVEAVHWMKRKLEQLGATTQLVDMGTEVHGDEPALPMPPTLIGKLVTSADQPSARPTVLIYGHLDVQKAYIEDGWLTDPFNLTELNGKLYGRGATDDKGPVVAWLNAIGAYQQTNQTLPVNLKFLFEAVEEVGSPKLEQFVAQHKKDGFFRDVDFVVISDNNWLTTDRPTLTYGLRGLMYFSIVISGPKTDLHSGGNGGSVFEPMHDLVSLLASLTITKPDGTSRIAVDGIYDNVAAVTDAERKMYENIEFDSVACAKLVESSDNTASEKQQTYSSACPVPRWRQEGNKTAILMSRWRFPSLTIHQILGGSSGTIIAARVEGKFSIRMVPDMKPDRVETLVREHLERVMRNDRRSPNTLNLTLAHEGSEAFYTDPFNEHYEAGKRAIKRVYGVEPDFAREGGTIPVAQILAQANNASRIILLPLGAAGDNAHAQNEKIDVRNFIEGAKVLAAYFYEVAQLPHLLQSNVREVNALCF